MFYRRLILILYTCLPALLCKAQQQIQFSALELKDGLSHNQVNAIYKDHQGLMWFGTLAGLNRYDGYQFKIFRHDPRDSSTLSDDFVTGIYALPGDRLYLETRGGPNIYDPVTETFQRDVRPFLRGLQISTGSVSGVKEDSLGNFWFNAGADGLYIYHTAQRRTRHLPCGGLKGLSAAPLTDMAADRSGNMWVIHNDQTIEKMDIRTGTVTLTIRLNPQAALRQRWKVFPDRSGGLWIYAPDQQQGITYYHPGKGTRVYLDKAPGRLNNNLVSSIIQDDSGMIWIGTDHGGVNLLNPAGFTISYLTSKEDDPKSIGQNSILSLYKDPAGIVWVGTFKKGVSYYHAHILKFPLYNHLNAGGQPYDDINRFAEDAAGNLWIGTNGGGLFYFNRKSGQFSRYQHRSTAPGSLANDVIVSLYIDRQQVLWIGTYFGGLDRFDGKTFTHYLHREQDPGSLSDDRVWDILEDRRGNLWVATLSGGLNRLDRATGKFSHIRAGQPLGPGSDNLSCLMEDRAGNIWCGTSDGIDVMQPDGHFRHYRNHPGDKNSLINNMVYDLMQDSQGQVWAATRDGISRFSPETGKFLNFDQKDGLTEKATLKIIEDLQHNLWVSTANGLFKVLVRKRAGREDTYVFRKYDQQDGLQGNAFNANAGFRTRAGELVFGGANGFNLFSPGQIRHDRHPPAIYFSSLQVNGREAGTGEKIDGRVLLPRALSGTREVTLRYFQNGFSIGFAALNYFNPRKIRYRYLLEGFDRHWQEVSGDNRRASYTNIDPGAYTFRVMSTDASGNWVSNQASLHIRIRPPLWKTRAALAGYLLAAGSILLLIRRRGIQRIRNEMRAEQEKQQGRRLHELDLMKIRFLTNVSHEFRTPLSLIITPLDKLIREAPESGKPQLQMIRRNGRRLLNLVNQLLDFRKMEEHELKLQLQPGEIIGFIAELTASFTDIAEQQQIRLDFYSSTAALQADFDHDKIERILFNLLSNAFKFTPAGGQVSVKLQAAEAQPGTARLELTVSDTGIGIAREQQERIFERFFQDDVPGPMVNQGSGIGLAITREFVRLHQGTIAVESIPEEGSTFRVSLLLGAAAGQPDDVPAQSRTFGLETAAPAAAMPETGSGKKPVLLLVEDHDDFRFYLKDNLKNYYQVAEAANGKEGWQKVLALQPALVVSDVSMPEMDGMALCRKIRADRRTAAVPVILLTALSGEEQQLRGLETGASDYLTKPFSFEILLSKIRNQLQQQQISRKTYTRQVEMILPEAAIESQDHKFIRQLHTHLEAHLADSGYTVDQLSTAMHMSRAGLYKKVLNLTGKPPLAYMRSYRLQQAGPMLLHSQLTIAEIAYRVGFSNPKHFSRCFLQEFGVLPSRYAAETAG